MKGLIGIVVLVVSGVVADTPAPYAPSGWRPSGPAFDLPPRVQPTKSQDYLPPFDPRNTGVPNPEYGSPDDVSVQGLPTQEQQPIFQTSPINGQQYQGPNFNSDIRNLDQNQRQTQYQQQQEIYRQFQRQRQLEAAQPTNKAYNLPSAQNPKQFASRPATPKSTTPKPEPTTETPAKQVTEAYLNEREILEDEGAPAKLRSTTTVEITRQNIQQYPGELYLSSLAQLQLQPQFVPLQQVRASYAQPAEVTTKQVGFDAPTHFAALPSVLAQQKSGNQQLLQNPQLLISEQPAAPSYATPQPLAQYQPATSYQPQPQYQQPIALQPQAAEQSYLPPTQDAFTVQQSVPQYQPVQMYQIQAQPIVLQPQQFSQRPSQVGQVQPKENDDDNYDQKNQANNENDDGYQGQQQPQQGYQSPQQINQQPQQVYQQPQQVYQQPQQVYQQPQQVYQQPQQVYQQPQQLYQEPQQLYQEPQQLYQEPLLLPPQPVNQYQAPQQLFPTQLVNQDQFYQGQYQPQLVQGAPQQNFQAQDALQSGLDVNNEANDIDQTEDKDSEEDDASRTTAIATAFGARTQPRVFTQYGAPFPVSRAQPASPRYPTTTESTAEEVTEVPENAEAVAVARARNGKLRNRRLRPVIAVDRSGRLVLAAE